MLKLLLAIHLVLAVFAIGPLVHAATTAVRGVRTGDGVATAAAARVLRIYAYASVLVVVAGFALMSQKVGGAPRAGGAPTTSQGVFYGGPPRRVVSYLSTSKHRLAEFSDTWIWLSLVLWVLAVAIVLAALIPALQTATETITGAGSASASAGRVAAAGGIVGSVFLAIVVLMVYRPGG